MHQRDVKNIFILLAAVNEENHRIHFDIERKAKTKGTKQRNKKQQNKATAT